MQNESEWCDRGVNNKGSWIGTNDNETRTEITCIRPNVNKNLMRHRQRARNWIDPRTQAKSPLEACKMSGKCRKNYPPQMRAFHPDCKTFHGFRTVNRLFFRKGFPDEIIRRTHRNKCEYFPLLMKSGIGRYKLVSKLCFETKNARTKNPIHTEWSGSLIDSAGAFARGIRVFSSWPWDRAQKPKQTRSLSWHTCTMHTHHTYRISVAKHPVTRRRLRLQGGETLVPRPMSIFLQEISKLRWRKAAVFRTINSTVLLDIASGFSLNGETVFFCNM